MIPGPDAFDGQRPHFLVGPEGVVGGATRLEALRPGAIAFYAEKPASLSRILCASERALDRLAYVDAHDPVPEVEKLLGTYAATGSDTLVLSAISGLDGYDTRPTLDDVGWRTLLANLDRLAGVAAAHGVRAVLQPRR